jgi:hypothetical protein
LTPDHLFAAQRKWSASLEAASGRGDDIAGHVDDPKILLYTDEGINLAWHNDMNRAFNDQIDIPWSALRPYLVKTPPIAIPP